MRMPSRKPLARFAAVAALSLAGTGIATAADWDAMTQEARDAYRHGQIWATYATNPALEARAIDVDVEGDTVVLTGTVETPIEKALAESIARSTQGVERVDNRLKVDPELVIVTATVTPTRAYAQRVEDATLAARVDSMLLWNEYTDGSDIQVQAHDGKVTLSGVADTEGARERATAIARRAMGVTSVANKLRVDSNATAQTAPAEVDDDWIEDKVQRTFLYSMLVNSSTLDVDVKDGDVTLRGHVDSPLERQMAIQLAQDTRGVDRVDAGGVVIL
jgi:osmotically-inducible protein OsmY